MGTRAFAVLVAVVFGGVTGACKSDLLPGRCDKDSDCPSGKCNLEMNGRCEPKDGGGTDALDGGDASDAGEVWSCEGAMCGGETPVCDTAMMKCRKCAANAECSMLSAAAPVCDPSGKCVACVGSTDCSDALAPICTVATNTCTKCSGHDECKARAAATPGCASSGKCVECTLNSHCDPATTKPVCDTAMNTCKGCTAGGDECAMINSMKPACATTGACVECVSNADCKVPTKPICDTTSNTCKPCKADAECTNGPKVCMSHQDGRCAKDEETIYVEATGNCASTVGVTNGTATVPFCSLDPAVAALGAMPAKNLVIVRRTVICGTPFAITARPVSIVGQLNASVTGAPAAIRASAGDLYVRNVKLSTGASIGCQADSGSTIRLDHVAVTGNSGGGILLNGAAFDIQNTTVSNNGAGTSGATTWGGILVTSLPVSGPAKLNLVTVQNNMGGGIACSAQLTMATGVLSSGNESPNINATCMFSSCTAASATCGAQP
jgi:hypothetical protein